MMALDRILYAIAPVRREHPEDTLQVLVSGEVWCELKRDMVVSGDGKMVVAGVPVVPWRDVENVRVIVR